MQTDIKKVIELLESGAEADIWYDAAEYFNKYGDPADSDTAKFIGQVQQAMLDAAHILKNYPSKPE